MWSTADRTMSISGTVGAIKSGSPTQPLGGVAVDVYRFEEDAFGEYQFDQVNSLPAITDASGAFGFTDLMVSVRVQTVIPSTPPYEPIELVRLPAQPAHAGSDHYGNPGWLVTCHHSTRELLPPLTHHPSGRTDARNRLIPTKTRKASHSADGNIGELSCPPNRQDRFRSSNGSQREPRQRTARRPLIWTISRPAIRSLHRALQRTLRRPSHQR